MPIEFIIPIVIGVLAIVTIYQGLCIVQQSQTVIIERLGRYYRTLSSGVNIIIPFIDRPRPMRWRYTLPGANGQTLVRFTEITNIDLRETVYDFPRQSVITKDNVVTEINAILYFQIVDPMRAMYEIQNLPDAIEKLTQTSLRNIIGEMDLDETLTSRDTINNKLRIILDEATNKWGVKVNRVELQDINPPRDIRDAMEKQMRAERDKRAQILQAEGQREALIRESEGKMQESINHAEGEKQAKILRAKAEAEAKAEAKQNQEPKLPESYLNERNQASTKGSTTTGEKNILSQPIDPPLQADTSAKITLTFDINNYESMTGTVDNKEIKYRAFEYIPYVSNPIDIDQQYINIYIPEEYFNNGTVNGYNTQTAPIFMPNNVGGYMPSQPMAPKVENNKPNSALYALSRGYVVASPATRGRTNKASDGNFIGKAPAVIVDLQAATAYLHANDATMPGNAKRIITNGTSAGGAVSLLQGATGNTSDYQPYLQALGAATASTDVYASSAYAPITNLDAADMAYEWSYNGITSFNKVTMGQGELPQANVGGAPAPMQRSVQRVNLTNDDVAYSDLLKSHFPDYVNNLQLRDRTGVILKLDKKGNGTFKQYVKSFIIDAANKAKSNGADLSRYSFLVLDKNTGMVKDIDWDAYNSFTSRSKAPGAFDSRSNDSGENSLFGTSTSDTNHFTITAALHDTTPNNDVYVENAKIVTMMNPMNYLGSPSATNAKYYRIRYGTADSNTSVAIPLIVGTRAQNLGYSVDMATPFGVDHAGDYDLQDLFNWMDSIVKNGR